MSGEVSRLWDTWVIDGLVNALAFVVKILSCRPGWCRPG